MNRTDVYKDIESKFGIVPTFFKTLPDDSLQMEWELMNRVHLEPGAVPNKYRELIGLGIAATSRCRYCTYFHTQIAKLFGATDAEIEETVHYAKSSAGWSTYLNGMQADYDLFKREVRQVCEYVGSQMARQPATTQGASAHTH